MASRRVQSLGYLLCQTRGFATKQEPRVSQLGPFEAQVQATKSYFWCACGLSKRQPFCDMSHKGTGINPVRFVAASTETVYLCGCKSTSNKPFCDGTHETEAIKQKLSSQASGGGA